MTEAETIPMTDFATHALHEDLALVTLNDPPANALHGAGGLFEVC